MGKDIKQQSVRKWILMLFVGPAVYFLFYWLVVQGTPEVPSQKGSLPEKYNLPGQVINVDNYQIQAGLPDQNIFTRELVIGNNNLVMAEAGKIFFIIPLFSDNYQINTRDFTLLDARGVEYSPLDVDEQYLAPVAQGTGMEIPKGMSVNYLLFKVKEDIEGYYLVMRNNMTESVWYFKR